MPKKSEINFYERFKQVSITYKTDSIKKEFLEVLHRLSCNPEIKFDLESLSFHEISDHIVVNYKVNMADLRVGLLMNYNCFVTEDFGFIITPFGKWYASRVEELYKCIIEERYLAYYDISRIEEGIILLTIEYNL